MRRLLGISFAILWLAPSVVSAVGQTTPGAQVVQTSLTEPGSTPFYLQDHDYGAESDPNEHIEDLRCLGSLPTNRETNDPIAGVFPDADRERR